MEKYLILKNEMGVNNSGEDYFHSYPERVSDTPLLFDPTVTDTERLLYSQVKLTGDPIDLKLVEDLLLSKFKKSPEVLFKEEEEIERNINEIIDDYRGEVPDNQSGIEGAIHNS